MAIKKRGKWGPDKNKKRETPPVGPVTEFRNGDDDAWYSVNLVLEGETLIVKYREFFQDGDEHYHAHDFKTPDEISAFGNRFRPLSKQLEGSDCWRVQPGMRVCALRVFSEDDHRFYDATVEAVKHEEHTNVNGEEKCSCTFLLSWLHGPEAGTLVSASIDNLCPILPQAHTDPRLACFLKIAQWKHEIDSPSSELFTDVQISDSAMQIESVLQRGEGAFEQENNEDEDLGGGDRAFSNARLTYHHCSLSEGREDPCTNLRKFRASSERGEKIDHHSAAVGHLMEDVSNIDLGQTAPAKTNLAQKDALFFILIENLEKEVSPSTIVDFIREATALEIEAFVFLSLPSEPYTRGALVVNSVEDLVALCNFVARPNQMITSSKGRPWIVSDSSDSELLRTSFWCLESDLKEEREHSAGEELKVVQLGSEEYSKAEKLRDLYVEFAKHQEQLFKRLSSEEQTIMRS